MIFNRKYKSLKFFKDKTINNQLIELSNQKKDFEYRRLLIEYFEIKLQISFSWRILFEIIAIFISLLSLIIINTPLFKFFIISSILFFVIALLLKRQYKKIIIDFKNSLLNVDIVIEKEHGISLPQYL